MSGGAQDLTLEGMARKLEALTERLGELEIENAGLRQKVATLTDSARNGTAALVQKPVIDFKGPVSRRALLGKAAAAVAAVAAGTLLNPREARADHHGPGIFVDFVNAHRDGGNQVAVRGDAPAGTGVFGIGKYGVWGDSTLRGHTAVVGRHLGDYGFGVLGEGKGSGAGVFGRNNTGFAGIGVQGQGVTGVKGESSASNTSGVWGRHTGSSGYGVLGEGTGGAAGVFGINPAGIGVIGESETAGASGVLGRNRGTGVGIRGEGWSGYGGRFSGGRAQLKLDPHFEAGRPTTGNHLKGEIYMDSNASLFVCTADGAPGTWRRLTTN